MANRAAIPETFTSHLSFTSAATNGLSLGLAIAAFAALAALAAAMWRSGKFLGRPLGVLISRLVPKSDERLADPAALQRLQRILGGVFAITLWIVAFMAHVVVLGRAEVVSGEGTEWSVWMFGGLVLQSALEGAVALGLLSGLVRLPGFV